MKNHWPHAPPHRYCEKGTYMVTAGTYQKMHYFKGDSKLELLQTHLFSLVSEHEWHRQAWAFFSNHYHFIAQSPSNPESLKNLITLLHYRTATEINILDNTPGRKVWHNAWDSFISFQTSYLARLKYVHNNPVKHKLVEHASLYKWCSAHWFEQTAPKSFYASVERFDTSQIKIYDDF